MHVHSNRKSLTYNGINNHFHKLSFSFMLQMQAETRQNTYSIRTNRASGVIFIEFLNNTLTDTENF